MKTPEEIAEDTVFYPVFSEAIFKPIKATWITDDTPPTESSVDIKVTFNIYVPKSYLSGKRAK